MSPVAFSGGLALLLAAPLMRGGNRHVALIVLELLALVILMALLARSTQTRRFVATADLRTRLVLMLAASPWVLALVQLTPLPGPMWAALPGHAVYAQALASVGASALAWRPVSLSPEATAASLLAGLPIACAWLLGYFSTLRQLQLMLQLVAGMAMAQILFGLLQISGGNDSPLLFGTGSNAPVGTFANRNHFANYVAMAICAYLWLAHEAMRHDGAHRDERLHGRWVRTLVWLAGGLFLVLGLLMSRSRGAVVFGLPLALLGLALSRLKTRGASRNWRAAPAVAVMLLLAATTLIGFDTVTARFAADQVSSAADFRATLAHTSLQGALAFWPWGSGWGTYDIAYPRFQPPSIAGFANHAHMDYIEMLFEGGVYFVVLALALLWLAVPRVVQLTRIVLRERTLDHERMAATLCGLGLAVLLLHSLVDFNLRIPANAILGALLAGAFLRPLSPPAHYP